MQLQKPTSKPTLSSTDDTIPIATVSISNKKTILFLSIILAILLLAHLFTYFVKPIIDAGVAESLDGLFNLSRENNFPSYFSAFLLLTAGCLFYIIYRTIKQSSGKWQQQWWLLGLVMVFLSFDEAVQIHERLTTISGSIFKSFSSGFLSFAWVIPYTILFIIVSAYFLRFVLALNVRTRKLFFISGILYVGGALGFEFLEGAEVAKNGFSFTYWLMVTIEEVMEMAGVIVLIYALLDYLKQTKANLRIV